MTVEELITKLQTMPPKAELWTGVRNDKGVSTYGLIDEVREFDYEYICDDLFGTPGKIDDRLLHPHEDCDKIVFIHSTFD